MYFQRRTIGRDALRFESLGERDRVPVARKVDADLPLGVALLLRLLDVVLLAAVLLAPELWSDCGSAASASSQRSSIGVPALDRRHAAALVLLGERIASQLVLRRQLLTRAA